jgi:hypothetical protein
MRWLLSALGILLAAVGILWILQGTNVLKGGLMGGHLQYAALGAVALIAGVVLVVLGNRRRRVAG